MVLDFGSGRFQGDKRWLKIELGICRGRQDPDKREHLRRKETDRETRRAMARRD